MMNETKLRARVVVAAAAVALCLIGGAAVLRHLVGDRCALTPVNVSQLTSRLRSPSSPNYSLKDWNVFLLCQPDERESLVKAISARGAEIESRIDANTDLVVTGAHAEQTNFSDVRQEARSLHIPVLDATRLARFEPAS